jgi:prevent-host-death family protein
MKIINIQAAKTHLSRIVEEVISGEEIVLAKAGKPLVKLVAFKGPRVPRTPGIFVGAGWESPGAWDSAESEVQASIDGPMFHGAVEEPPPAR